MTALALVLLGFGSMLVWAAIRNVSITGEITRVFTE